jgi:glycolate oxidase
MTANHILGLRVVLPDGEPVDLGGESTEHVGPDWSGLFCGCEGLFGIATQATLRLVPVREAVRTALAVFDSLERAGDAVAAIVGAGLVPVAMEIMDPLAIEAAEASVKPGYPKGEALLIVELEGEEEVVARELAAVEELLRHAGCGELRSTADPVERALIWKGRKSAFSAVGWLSPDYIVQDGVVPRTRLGEALREIERMGGERKIRVANVFHAGDGNLHPLILFDGREAGAVERAEELAADILALCVELGGSITGEHGVGVEKRDYMKLMFSAADLALMEDLRAAVDPGRLANRGKMLIPPAAVV